MPYIRKELRPEIDAIIDPLIRLLKDMNAETRAGCLTYIIFKLILIYKDSNWYGKMDALKACESAMDEFRRRFIHSYEDLAIKANGDVILL